ncbi:FMN-binding glutamate synthase family protein [Thalassomonas viridans]|uniref:FMN-binding glutamate synthase family protein n=1 Tax=Thalassomonas viridans TaxID=137584 RepID=A0AAF0CEB8_9GAMM|nr:FMN-binding glutamate synthase family protein [Thalassomonas viridans]WDE08669.1 FMN-binding glutamate synthase family protein [Thalassomonas viridans]
MRKAFIFTMIAAIMVIIVMSGLWPAILWAFIVLIPLVVLGSYDMMQQKHALWRTFPVLGHGRWLLESVRPYLRQYWFESDTDGVPVNRMFRTVIYQRAKGELDTVPYGTQLDTKAVGYEWIGHSLAAKQLAESETGLRVTIGGPHCRQPYSASILNISAMSFGALSDNAIRALNKGAKQGGFAHNTGEGGISPYHSEYGGDLIWQIGTGYFGCRTSAGEFCPQSFKKIAAGGQVKMIEIKLSQGAKPGHGGILPAAKNTPEIAAIRKVKSGARVVSPPAHSAFDTPVAMMAFIGQLRELSLGKPIGFKLAVGRKSEFFALCKAMIKTGITPDFITVDGGEGGTGAAPLEYANSVGMPLREALGFVCDTLTGFGLKKDIKVIAGGKIFTGFHVVKNIAMGADVCNSARGMMVALGCIQSLTCNSNKCPVGIATQNPSLSTGVVVNDKAGRVARFHRETVKATAELIAAAGLHHSSALNRSHIYRRVSQTEVKRYDEIYPPPKEGCFLTGNYPEHFQQEMAESCADSFMPQHTAFVPVIDRQQQAG